MLEEITKTSINKYTYRSHRHTPCKSTFEVADHRAWPSLEFWGNWFPTQEHTLTAFSLPPKRVSEEMWKGPFTLFLECIYLAFDFYDSSLPGMDFCTFKHSFIPFWRKSDKRASHHYTPRSRGSWWRFFGFMRRGMRGPELFGPASLC